MAPAGAAFHASQSRLTAPLAASPASFQPSKAAMITGADSFGIPASSITHHLPPPGSALQPTLSHMITCSGARRQPAPGPWAWPRRPDPLDWGAYDEH